MFFGSEKHKYSLHLIMAQLSEVAKTSISMAFLCDVRREDPEASQPLFYRYLCMELCIATSWLALGGVQNFCLLETTECVVDA